jgi:hypothetical protein
MNLKKRTMLCLFGFFLISAVFGQNEKFKALFIYNFTNYIEWPSSGPTFSIAVLGESPIIDELENISKIKKIANATIVVKRVNSASEAAQSQILFIPPSKKKVAAEAEQTLAGKSILIITDSNSVVYGINFLEIGQKQSFQVSKSAVASHNLKLNSTLLSLGIQVN